MPPLPGVPWPAPPGTTWPAPPPPPLVPVDPRPPPGPRPAPPVADTTAAAPPPPSKPPGPPAPPLLEATLLAILEGPPSAPRRSRIPAMVTLPLARIVTGVFVAFRVTFTVAKGGMLTLVKLNTPLGGRASVVVPFGGVNAP